MRAPWRLALAGLSARRSRTILLTGAVALSAALVAAVSCAIASVNGAVQRQLESQLGRADVRLSPAGSGATLPDDATARVEAWAGVARATPIHEGTLSLAFDAVLLSDPDADGSFTPAPRTLGTSVQAIGTPLDRAGPLANLDLLAGRLPAAEGEIVIDALVAYRLSGARAIADGPEDLLGGGRASYLDADAPVMPDAADAAFAGELNALVGIRPGDTVAAVRFLRRNVDLRVVGVAGPPPMGGRPRVYGSIDTLTPLTGAPRGASQVEIVLDKGVDPDAFVLAHAEEFGQGAVLATTERIASGVQKNVSANRVGFLLASMLAFLSAAFIIMTGLTTGLGEQQRALAVLRCIGATRTQLAQAQLLNGALVGAMGAVVGVPLGVALAFILTAAFRERIPTGLAVSPWMLAVSGVGSVLAGVLGAAWPAWSTSRLSPLAGLTARARPATARGVVLTTLAGLAGLALMAALVGLPRDGQVIFWGYVTLGLPAMFIGYFLLSVPLVAVVARLTAPGLTAVLRLPPRVLSRTIRATPYRHGFTAGAMMNGLALMVAVWTNGGAFLRDWIARIDFPDAFVSGLSITPEAQALVDRLEFVERTSAISLQPVEVDVFGIRGLTRYRTMFVAFEQDPFFDIVSIDFVEGDETTARRRLAQGGCVIVAQEFRTAKGLGVGDRFVCVGPDGAEHDFEIVGVVRAPGLQLVSTYFDFGESVTQQALHYVFGSLDDARARFGTNAAQLLAVDLDDDVSDDTAIPALRDATFGAGVTNAGSGRMIKAQLVTFIGTSLVVFSFVAVGAMLIACFGVANLIAAGIHARRFELGVLRAVGGSRSLLARLIAAEALIIALTAALVGTLMGLQGAWAGRVLYTYLIGIELRFWAPALPIAAGWLVVVVLTVGAAAPSAMWLNRRRPRELIASGR